MKKETTIYKLNLTNEEREHLLGVLCLHKNRGFYDVTEPKKKHFAKTDALIKRLEV
jgi:hypothetical protein